MSSNPTRVCFCFACLFVPVVPSSGKHVCCLFLDRFAFPFAFRFLLVSSILPYSHPMNQCFSLVASGTLVVPE